MDIYKRSLLELSSDHTILFLLMYLQYVQRKRKNEEKPELV